MPLYDYTCTGCDARFERQMRIAERLVPTETPCVECNARIELAPAAPSIGDAFKVGGGTRLPDTWKDTLKRIKSHHRRSTINTQS